MYLLDTNVISELARTPSDAAVMTYFRSIRRDAVFTSAVCLAERDDIGKPISAEDGMIAATAQTHSASVLTRNVRDFVDCGIRVINPWTDPPPP